MRYIPYFKVIPLIPSFKITIVLICKRNFHKSRQCTIFRFPYSCQNFLNISARLLKCVINVSHVCGKWAVYVGSGRTKMFTEQIYHVVQYVEYKLTVLCNHEDVIKELWLIMLKLVALLCNKKCLNLFVVLVFR